MENEKQRVLEWAEKRMPKSRRTSHRKHEEHINEWVESHSWADCLRIERENIEAANRYDDDDYGMDDIDARLDHQREGTAGYIFLLAKAERAFENGKFDEHYNLLTLDCTLFDEDNIDGYKNEFEENLVRSLLEENCFFRELEMFDRNKRIFQSLW